MTSMDGHSRACLPPLSLHAALVRKFLTARAPGSLATPITANPEAAADIAEKIAETFIEQARTDERERCAAMLREHATRLRAVAKSLNGLVAVEATERAADLIDPQGPVQGARAAGGTS